VLITKLSLSTWYSSGREVFKQNKNKNMKRNVFYILLLLVFFTACKDEDNDVEKYNIGSNFVVATSTYTTLDNTVTLKCTAAYNVSNIDVTLASTGASLGSITIADGIGTLSIPVSGIGLTVVGKSASILYTAYAEDGTAIKRTSTVTLASPFKITLPTLTQKNKGMEFIYSIAPKFATVTSVSIQTKTNKAGTYVDVAGPFDVKKDTLLINGSGYKVNDTIYVKLSASTAALNVENVSTIVVNNYTYANAKTVKLDTTTNAAYDLLLQRVVNVTTFGDSSDVVFTQTPLLGGFTMGFTAPKNAEFVKSTENVYSLGDIVAIEATDFSSAVKSFNDVAVDDVFIYRTKRGTGAYAYGIFQIVTVAKPEGVMADSYIEF